MDAYIYRAALYCEECAEAIRARLSVKVAEVDREDSDRFPQGPYSDGGGEADCPQHCDACGVFLENPLTEDGREYVRDQIRAKACQAFNPDSVLNDWRKFYGESVS